MRLSILLSVACLLLTFGSAHGGWKIDFPIQQAVAPIKSTELVQPNVFRANYKKNANLGVWNAYKAPEASAVFKWAKKQTAECYLTGGVGEPCPATHAVMNIQRFAVKRDAAKTIVVVLVFPSGGNSWSNRVVAFAPVKGRYQFIREIEGTFGFVEGVKREAAAWLITTKTLRSNDPRCCPSGKTIWRANIKTGTAKYHSGNKLR